MDTFGYFVFHDGAPHLVLDSFPKHLLVPQDAPALKEGEIAPEFMPPAIKGEWQVESSDGSETRDGFLYALHSHLGENGRREAMALCESLKSETFVRGQHRIRFGVDGGLVGWGRTSQAS